jgi:hypothetical protein
MLQLDDPSDRRLIAGRDREAVGHTDIPVAGEPARIRDQTARVCTRLTRGASKRTQ